MKKYFSRIFSYWKALGHLIGLVMTPVHMLIVYVLAIGPANLATRVVAKDPLDRKIDDSATFWKEKEVPPASLESLRHTF